MNLTSAAAVALGQSLSELPSLQNLTINGSDGCSLQLEFSVFRELNINGVTEFSAEAVTRLIDVIKNKLFEKLELSEINLTLAVAQALGQSLPELSALQTLKISGLDESRLQHKEVEPLFVRFNRPSSLKELWFTDFTARGSLASLVKNLCLFPCLKVLKLEDLAMGEGDLSGLLENLKFTPGLRSLHLRGNPVGHAVRSMIPYLLGQQKLEVVYFRPGDCSEEDLKYVHEAVKEKGPRLNIETLG